MAFLSDALRQQAIAEMRGQMLQDQIAKQVSRQIIGQIANQEIGRSMQSEQSRGRAIQSAADKESRRDVGRTQLEMQRDIAQRQKTLGLIGSAASATGALGAHLAMQGPDPSESSPEAKVPTKSVERPDYRGVAEDLLMYGQGPGSGGVPVVEDQDIVSAIEDLDLTKEPGLQSTLEAGLPKLVSLIR